MAEVNARLATAQRDLQGARELLHQAEQRLSEAQRTNAAAAAAHGLCPGEECPVCQSDLPQGWVPPRDTGLDAAREAHGEAKLQANEAIKVVADLEAQEKSGRHGTTDTRRDLGDLRSEISGALDRLRGTAGLDDPFPPARDTPLPDREQVLAPVQRQLDEAAAKLSEHRTEAEGLRQAQTNAQMAETSARQTLKHGRDDTARTRGTAGEVLSALKRNLQSIPLPFRPDLVLPSDPLELETVDTAPVNRASYTAREREEILALREKKRERLRTEIEETSIALKRLGEIRKTQVEEPLQALGAGAGHDNRTALAEAVRELTTDVAVPASRLLPGGRRDAPRERSARSAKQWSSC